MSYIFISWEKTSFAQNWTKWSEWVEFAVYFFFHSFKCRWEIKIYQCNMFVNFKILFAKMSLPLNLQKCPNQDFQLLFQKKPPSDVEFMCLEKFLLLCLMCFHSTHLNLKIFSIFRVVRMILVCSLRYLLVLELCLI